MGLWAPTGRMRKTMLKKASECVQGSDCCSFLLAWGSDDRAEFSLPPHAQPSSAFRAAQLCDGASCALEGEQHPRPPPTDARGTSPIVMTKTVCAKCSQTHTAAHTALCRHNAVWSKETGVTLRSLSSSSPALPERWRVLCFWVTSLMYTLRLQNMELN